jgi:predicted DCC family thiol-disulfide oxidoreductase YuxK
MSIIDYNNLDKPILLYDGYCNLCGWLVGLVKRFDSKGRITLIPSQNADEILSTIIQKKSTKQNSVVFISKQGQISQKSHAVMSVLKVMGGLWMVLWGVMYIIPVPIRNFVYDFVARNRYRWFGERSTCYLP